MHPVHDAANGRAQLRNEAEREQRARRERAHDDDGPARLVQPWKRQRCQAETDVRHLPHELRMQVEARADGAQPHEHEEQRGYEYGDAEPRVAEGDEFGHAMTSSTTKSR